MYTCQCWGAQGGSRIITSKKGLENDGVGGKGAYVIGNISLTQSKKIFLFVGNEGYNEDYSKFKVTQHIFNGGGKAIHTSPGPDGTDGTKDVGCSGGGASDIRLINGDWDNFNGLKSRIIIAAGGGGNGYDAGNVPGAGGGLKGLDASGVVWFNHSYNVLPTGGTQTSGGISTLSDSYGTFGTGGTSYGDYDGGGGGGSGYYGGGGGYVDNGAGGSSFISGYTGCNAIAESSTEANIVHTGSPNHYSGYVFSNGVMKAGNESMPSPSGGTETGHAGNGYAKITWAL